MMAEQERNAKAIGGQYSRHKQLQQESFGGLSRPAAYEGACGDDSKLR